MSDEFYICKKNVSCIEASVVEILQFIINIIVNNVTQCYAGGWDNNIIMGHYYNDIQEFDAERRTWKTFGSMSIKRAEHAVSVINFLEIQDYCN